MKFSIENRDLLKALSNVSRAISQKTNSSVKQCVKIKTVDMDKIELTASDDELSIISIVPASVSQRGEIIIQAKILLDLIKTYSDETVEFEVSENSVITVECAGSVVNLNGQDAAMYPDIDIVEIEKYIAISKEKMYDLIKDTSFACSNNGSINPILTGVNVQVDNEKIKFTALDGYKLAQHTEAIDENDVEVNAVVPQRTMNEIMKIMTSYDEDILLGIADHKLSVKFGDHTFLISNLLDGEFINYQRLIPKEIKTVVKLNKQTLLTKIERASVVVDETRNSLIKMDFNDDILTIKSSSDRANVSDPMQVNKNGDDLKIAFSSRFFIDVLKNISDENIVIEFKDKSSSCLIKPTMDDRYLYLIMPVRYTD